MANYDIPQYPIKRLRYFNNQFLNEQDFIDAESYQIALERVQLRSLCVAGVCEGMSVGYPDLSRPPTISAGVAVDRKGRLIILDRDTPGPAKIPGLLAAGDYVLHIRFAEGATDMAPPVAGGAQDNTRWQQQPVIDATARTAPLPDDAIALGSFTIAANNLLVAAGSALGRQYSGLRLPGLAAGAATLSNSGAAGDAAQLTGTLLIRRDTAAGALGPVLTLMNGLGGAGAGGAIDWDGYDPGGNDPALRLQSIDDGAASSHLAFATKQPGAAGNKLVERLRLTSDGLLQFSSESKDKLVAFDNGPGDRYGLGVNGNSLSLFIPAGARFSLRHDSSAGSEVFTVNGAGVGHLGALTVDSAVTTLQLSVTNSSVLAGPVTVQSGLSIAGLTTSTGQLSVDTAASPAISGRSSNAIGLFGVGNDAGLQSHGSTAGVRAVNAVTGVTALLATQNLAADLQGDVRITGARLKNNAGFGIVETNASDWLRINPDQQYPGIALYRAVGIGTGGLSVGDFTQMPVGQLRVTSTATFLGNVNVSGTTTVGGPVLVENGAISIKTMNNADSPTGVMSGIHVQHGGAARITGVFGLQLPSSVANTYYAVGVGLRGALHGRSFVGTVTNLFSPFNDSGVITDGPRTSDDGRVRSDCAQVFWRVADGAGFNINGYVAMF